jgi:hypothetical protein
MLRDFEADAAEWRIARLAACPSGRRWSARTGRDFTVIANSVVNYADKFCTDRVVSGAVTDRNTHTH